VQTWHYILRKPLTAINDINALRARGSVYCSSRVKEELGLDHFEGRSWQGLHRHALMTMIAYAFLQHRRLAAASGGKKNPLGPTQADAPSRPKSRRSRLGPRAALPMPPLQKAHPQKTRIKVPK